MRARRGAQSVVSNPVLVGAVTVLVTVVAVFLAYNANKGLPFVPTTQVNVSVPSGNELVVGNEVREGGALIGFVGKIDRNVRADGTAGATVQLVLQKTTGAIPVDTSVVVRPRSALGLKYVDLTRGASPRVLAQGATIIAGPASEPPELDDFFSMFKAPTRRDIQRNLATFGAGFAGRGLSLNETFRNLPPLLSELQPVMRNLSDPETNLGRFFKELGDAARVTAPVADDFAEGFTSAADTFEAFSRYPESLRDAISTGPPLLREGTPALREQRPFFRNLASISTDIRGAAREARATLPTINVALETGTPVLRRSPELNRQLEETFRAVEDLTSEPRTNVALRALRATNETLNPTLRYLGPYVTVCNNWNYWWTNLADHLSERDGTGSVQRILMKTAPAQNNSPNNFGAVRQGNGENVNPTTSSQGDPFFYHGQAYGAAIDAKGNADCEIGQRGFPRRLAKGAPADLQIAVDPRTPGNQGPTFTGRSRVPRGETFSSEPDGRGPRVVTP